jgi:hypothetical protein
MDFDLEAERRYLAERREGQRMEHPPTLEPAGGQCRSNFCLHCWRVTFA